MDACVGISPAWEEESPKPQKSEKSLEKVLGPSGPKSLKKVSGRVRKVSKKSRKGGFSRLFGLSPRLFSDFWGPRVRGLFRDFFQTFGVSARRLLLPGRRDPDACAKNHGRPRQQVCFLRPSPVMGRNFLTPGHTIIRVRNVRQKFRPKHLCLPL